MISKVSKLLPHPIISDKVLRILVRLVICDIMLKHAKKKHQFGLSQSNNQDCKLTQSRPLLLQPASAKACHMAAYRLQPFSQFLIIYFDGLQLCDNFSAQEQNLTNLDNFVTLEQIKRYTSHCILQNYLKFQITFNDTLICAPYSI